MSISSSEERFNKNVEAFNNPKPGYYWSERSSIYFIILYVVDDLIVVLDTTIYGSNTFDTSVVTVYSKLDFEAKIKYESAFGKPLNKDKPTFVADCSYEPMREDPFNSLIRKVEMHYPGGIKNSVIQRLIAEKKYSFGKAQPTPELHIKIKHLSNPQLNDVWNFIDSGRIVPLLKVFGTYDKNHIVYSNDLKMFSNEFDGDKLKIVHRNNFKDLLCLPIENYSLIEG